MTVDDEPLWEGDVNEAVVEAWTAETTPFERVQEVVRSTSTPLYAGEIADRARVSEPTARSHLKRLATTGHAESVETTRGVRYKRSRQTIAMGRIAELHRDLSKAELVAGIKRLRDAIADLQDRFDATDPDDLALQIEDGAEATAWNAVAEWRSVEENLDIAKAALAIYDFDPDAEGTADVGSDGVHHGSFARSAREGSGSSETA